MKTILLLLLVLSILISCRNQVSPASVPAPLKVQKNNAPNQFKTIFRHYTEQVITRKQIHPLSIHGESRIDAMVAHPAAPQD